MAAALSQLDFSPISRRFLWVTDYLVLNIVPLLTSPLHRGGRMGFSSLECKLCPRL